MKDLVVIVAGLFLMLSVLATLLLGVLYVIGIEDTILVPHTHIVGVVLALSILVGLYDGRVFANAKHWLGLWS
ncbi:MAG: hypothetical protein RLZZ70_736 [Candidatus Parcubacteria bacterium]|jgi:hypothetical protein